MTSILLPVGRVLVDWGCREVRYTKRRREDKWIRKASLYPPSYFFLVNKHSQPPKLIGRRVFSSTGETILFQIRIKNFLKKQFWNCCFPETSNNFKYILFQILLLWKEQLAALMLTETDFKSPLVRPRVLTGVHWTLMVLDKISVSIQSISWKSGCKLQ